jgi:cephalosporin-C deacetylase-like acetyl esterase
MNAPDEQVFRFLATAGLLLTCAVASGRTASDDFATLPAQIAGAAPGLMMEVYLKQQAFAALDRREAAFEKLQTREHLRGWQQERRATFLAALGGFPERTALHARTVGQLSFADYRLEKLIFESQPGFHVTATLYLPLTPGPHPAVVHPTGHSENAKARDLYQRASIVLAKNGVACLCYDPVGQGERRQYFDANGKPSFGTTGEHSVMDVSCALLGTSVARYMIWDGMRAVDSLQARTDIDPTRIGAMGISGGGTLSSYLSALDERIAVAAPGCYLTGFRRLLETLGPQDAEQNLFGQIARGLDHGDYVMLRAPRPTLIMAATKDYFDITGAWHLFRQSKRFYTRLGFAERVDLIEADTTHGFPMEMRVGAARWMRRWFLGSDTPVTETDFPVLGDAELRCTPEGQVLRLPGARTLIDLNGDWESRLAAERARLWRDPGAALREIRRITGIRPAADLPAVKVEFGRKLGRNGVAIHQMILQPEPGIWLPALRFEPESARRTGDPILYLHGRGKQVDAAPGGPIETLALSGRTVLAVDLRGLGETSRPSGPDAMGAILGFNSRDTTLAHLLGKSFVAMRAEDVLVCARYLASLADSASRPARVAIVAKGEPGVPALHAAALEPQLFSSLELQQSLASWADVARSPESHNQKINVVFGALRAYDLPDLVASLPRDKCRIVDPRDAQGPPQ